VSAFDMRPDPQAKPALGLDIFVGRQPIFDRYQRVIGYELLYRGYKTDHASFLDGDRATSQVILNSFADIGVEDIVGSGKIFINLTRNFFLDKYPIPFLPKKLVIEVTEDIIADQPILDSLNEFSKQGYQIALDDVSHPYMVRKLLSIADLVKMDIQQTNMDRMSEYARHINQYKAKLLAEKVETREEFDLCMRLGFDYFQGFFLCKPNLISARQIPTSRLVLLQLLGRIQDPNINFQTLEDIIAQDATLGYKLLRLTNSAYLGIPTQIESIRQAIAMLGLDKVKSWLTLILLAESQDKPKELTVFAMVRAKMAEQLAIAARTGSTEKFFLTGLFSSLGAFMDQPIEHILSTINLSDQIVNAILEYEGDLGQALKCVLAYEKADWDNVQFRNLTPEKIRDIYLSTLAWVEEVKKSIQLV